MLLYFFIFSILLAVVAYLLNNRNFNHIAAVAHAILILIFTWFAFSHKGEIMFEYFRADHISLIFLAILCVVTLLASFHYIGYSLSHSVEIKTLRQHNTSVILFNTAVVGVLMANHFGVLWVFIELTTIAVSFLIQHDQNQESTEATWKYLFICSIAIAMAFVGILFLGIATREVQSLDLSFDAIKGIADQMPTTWMSASFLLILTGFSVKLGLVPMFNVDIDAKDASPSPVGAMLSSVLVNSGFVAVFRFYSAFAGTSILPWMNKILIIVGVLSLFFAAVYMLRVRNIKRMMAYSSMEHASLVMLAMACGGIGYFAAIFHLIMHALIKSTFFFQVSQLTQIYDSKMDYDIRDYISVNPLGSLVLIGCLFSVIALPPSGLFISEYLIFQSMYDSGRWWLMAFTFFFLLFIIYGLMSRFLPILFAKGGQKRVAHRNICRWESGIQLVMISLVFYIGLFKPNFVVDLINNAISQLPN